LHHKLENIAARVTAEAFEDLFGRVNVEGRVTLRMQRTEANELITGTSKAREPSNEFD
jgi:hypothetical protein